jgi:hypothetical protein
MKNNHKYVNFDQAHDYVGQNAASVNPAIKDIFWDGYDIVVWKRNPGGYMVNNGMYRNGAWGTTRRIKMTDRGTWRVPVNP